MKINESKQIRMKTNWMETVIKVDLTKSFSNCPIHTDPVCQIFSKNSFNGKIASKLFKFE